MNYLLSNSNKTVYLSIISYFAFTFIDGQFFTHLLVPHCHDRWRCALARHHKWGAQAASACATPNVLRNAAVHPGRRFPRSFFSSVLLWRGRVTRSHVV